VVFSAGFAALQQQQNQLRKQLYARPCRLSRKKTADLKKEPTRQTNQQNLSHLNLKLETNKLWNLHPAEAPT
jgi:hypothetical protein